MQSVIYGAHAKFLSDRSITTDIAAANGIHSISSGAATTEFGRSVYGDALYIPYRDSDGLPVIADDGTPYVRIRVLDVRNDDELMGEKPQRYLSRSGAGVRLYVPNASGGGYPFLILTEGEFKAAASSAHGMPAVAIPGVTMWSADPGTSLSDDTSVHPHILSALREINPAGVLVLADSDAKGNRNVRQALGHLAAALTKALCIPCLYARVPDAKPEDDTAKAKKEAAAKKQGLDDWIKAEGADQVKRYLNWQWDKLIEREQVLAKGGYYPLGYQGENNYVWSVARGCIITFGSSDNNSKAKLMNLVGGQSWCEARYGEIGPRGKMAVDFDKMGGDLIQACIEAGPFSVEMCRGSGVWADGDALVVSGGDVLWRTDGAQQERFGTGYAYPRSRPLGIKEDITPATAKQAMALLECLSTWGFRSQSECMQVFGWIALSYLTGALPWRPHASLTAPRGSGKSQLQKLVKNLLGHAAVACDADSTAPGIRQALRQDTLALLLDEAESSGKKLQATMDMLRSASSGSEVLRGTQDQAGTSFTLRTMALVTGIVPPTFNAADESRFVRVELDALPKASQTTPHELLINEPAAKSLGLSLFARMLRAWPRLLDAETLIRKSMDGDSRFRDTFAPVLAAAWVALHDNAMTEIEAKQFVNEMHLDAQRARVCEADDDADVVSALLGKVIKVTIGERSVESTIADLIINAAAEVTALRSTKGPTNRALGLYGMRVNLDSGGSLLVNVKAENFQKLFDTSKALAGSDLSTTLKRNRLVEPKMTDTMTIGGRSVRCYVVRIKDLLAANDAVFAPALTTAAELA